MADTHLGNGSPDAIKQMTEAAFKDSFTFSHSGKGVTRWPPNVEQVRVERDSVRVWLIARRNDVELKFPLEKTDCEHLAALLLAAIDYK